MNKQKLYDTYSEDVAGSEFMAGMMAAATASVYTPSVNGDHHAVALGCTALIFPGGEITTLCAYCGEPRCICWKGQSVIIAPEPTP